MLSLHRSNNNTPKMTRDMLKPLPALFFLLLTTIHCLKAEPPLPVTTPADEYVSGERLKHVHELAKSMVDEGKHAGISLLIARNGRIVDRQSWGKRNIKTGEPMEHDTIFRIYSMTKVITSVAVLQLVEQGKMQLRDPVAKWIPELSSLQVFTGGTAEEPVTRPARSAVTVRMLLNHTAGFTYDFFSGSPVHELYKEANLWESETLDAFIGKVARLPLLSEPGTEYNYSIGLDIAGLLVQRISGIPFEDFIAQNITEPLNMKDTAFDVPEEKHSRLAVIHEHGANGNLQPAEPILGAYSKKQRGIPSGGGGLFSTIGDYARFAQALLNEGELQGTRILSRKSLELALKNSLTETGSPYHGFAQGDGWGLIGAVRIDPAVAAELGSKGMFYWSGAATTHFFVDPREHLVALIFAQHVPFDEHNLFSRFRNTVYQSME